MANRQEAPEVNTGSMADIAFLLLIFFLVTTSIETDVGLDRMLPRWDADSLVVNLNKKNILPILIDGDGKLLVDEKLIVLKDIREITIAFLDNGGAEVENQDYCDYCQGAHNPTSSDNPIKAVVSLMSSRETSYGAYISVQNELVGAYNYLRNREAQRLFKMDYTAMEAAYSQVVTSGDMKKILKKNIKTIQDLFPMKLLEAQWNSAD